MQFGGGYPYPGMRIAVLLASIVLIVDLWLWRTKELELRPGLILLFNTLGTVLWASALTPVGLLPPPQGGLAKVRWFFSQQGGIPFSLNQPMFFIGIAMVIVANVLTVR